MVVFDKVGIVGIFVNFFKVLIVNCCLFVVSDVICVYCVLVVKFKGEVIVDVIVVEVFFDKNFDVFKVVLKLVIGKDVVLNVKVDFLIIGGFVVKLGSCMVDGLFCIKFNLIKYVMKEVG